MALSPARVLRGMRKNPAILNALLHGVDAARALSATDGADGWSVLEVVCHLRDFEKGVAERIMLFLSTPNPTFDNFDAQGVAARGNYKAANLREAFDTLVELRRQNLAKLATLTPEQWSLTGSNPNLGTMTLLEVMGHVALHDTDHHEQIVRCLGLSEALIE